MEGEAESAGRWLSRPEAVFLVLTFLLLGSTAQGSEPGGSGGLRYKELREHRELDGKEGRAGSLEEQASLLEPETKPVYTCQSFIVCTSSAI